MMKADIVLSSSLRLFYSFRGNRKIPKDPIGKIVRTFFNEHTNIALGDILLRLNTETIESRVSFKVCVMKQHTDDLIQLISRLNERYQLKIGNTVHPLGIVCITVINTEMSDNDRVNFAKYLVSSCRGIVDKEDAIDGFIHLINETARVLKY